MGFDLSKLIRTQTKVYINKRNKKTYTKTYSFKCLDCDTIINIQKSSFKTHTGKCRICCQRGKPYEASYNELKKTCKRRKLKITLTYIEYVELCKIKTCHYCNTDLKRTPFSKVDKKESREGRRYMLDRKDNDLGYTFENCVPCCWKCNSAKSNRYTYEEWYNMTKYLRDLRN